MNTLALDVLENIPTALIDVGPRLRLVDRDHAALIAESFRVNGQMAPIEVRRSGAGRFALISGAHRLFAADLAGMETIAAVIVDVDDDVALLREIDENLCRRDLTELDRAAFLAERKAVWLRMHPETGRGKRAGGKGTDLSLFPAFAREVAEKLGISHRSVNRAIARAAIEPDLRRLLALTRWADHGATLDALLKADEATRRRLVLALTRDEKPAKTIGDAMAEIRGKRNTPDPAEEQFLALKSRWEKAAPKARRKFLAYLAEMGAVPAPAREAA